MKLRFFNIVALTLLSMTAGLHAQNPAFTLQVEAPVVPLEVIVQDASGKPVTNLTQGDFTVYEDGQLQSITLFSSVDTPRSILLLIDKYFDLPFLTEAVNSFFRTLRPRDRIAVAGFDRDLRIALDWRQLRNGQPQTVQLPKFPVRAQMQATTNVYDSLEEASRRFRDEKGRKGILVLTNGYDDEIMRQLLETGKPLDIAADRDFKKHQDTLKKAAIPIYFVSMYSDLTGGIDTLHRRWFWNDKAKTDFLTGARLRMEKLAAVTGGRTYISSTAENIVTLYGQIGLDLGISYSLAYRPIITVSDATRPRRIEVRVRDRGLTVIQSRTEYSVQ